MTVYDTCAGEIATTVSPSFGQACPPAANLLDNRISGKGNDSCHFPNARRTTESRFLTAIRKCTLTVLLVASALGVTALLQRELPYPFLFLFFAAVMTSAWFGGRTAGLLAVLLSTLAVDYFFVPPFYSFRISATEVTYFLVFVVCAVVASWVSSSKRKSEEALKQIRNQLELRVAERTAELQISNTELRRSEHQLRLLTEVMPQQIWSARPNGSVDYCNQRLLEYVARTMDQMHGNRLMETVHPEGRDSFGQAWQSALSSGMPLEGEWRVRGAGGHYRWFFIRAVPLRDAHGTTLRWYGTNTDIDDHKNAEQALARTQSELAHLSRVLTMGELAASIAHEVNQPLTAVVTYGGACMEWLSSNPPNVEQAKHAVGRIIKDGSRAGAVLHRIRAMFKKETPAKEWLDINEVIHELAAFLRDKFTAHHIVWRTDLAPSLPKVKGDRIQLQQVVLNLVMNSIDALERATSGPKELAISSRKETETGIVVRIEDSGVGLSPDIAAEIFNPFFTTKAQGIGMGLSISRSIVEAHHGRLWVTSRPRGGAIFQFSIPSAHA
jgi:PAS domain S-box-containing protein